MQHLVNRFWSGRRFKWRPPGQQAIQDGSQRIGVGCERDVVGPPRELFRWGIFRRAENVAREGDVAIGFGELSQTEVGNPRLPETSIRMLLGLRSR